VTLLLISTHGQRKITDSGPLLLQCCVPLPLVPEIADLQGPTREERGVGKYEAHFLRCGSLICANRRPVEGADIRGSEGGWIRQPWCGIDVEERWWFGRQA
jgi:hypothetical protein